MPRPDLIPSPRLSLLRQFRRIMQWVALFAMAIAAIAVLLVARGDNGTHVHMLIAVALGAGLSVLLAGALMSLVFFRRPQQPAEANPAVRASRSELEGAA